MGLIGNLEYHVASEAFINEVVSGDTAFVKQDEHGIMIGVIDVAGHGPQAEELAQEILRFLEKHYKKDLKTLLEQLHEYIHKSRGCAANFCSIDMKSNTLYHIGIGNVTTLILGSRHKRLLNRDGVIGYLLPRIRIEEYAFTPDDYLVIYSDGIKDHFDLQELFPGNTPLPGPRVVATRIMAHCAKENDDSICFVGKFKHAE